MTHNMECVEKVGGRAMQCLTAVQETGQAFTADEWTGWSEREGSGVGRKQRRLSVCVADSVRAQRMASRPYGTWLSGLWSSTSGWRQHS